jgi:radical SAM superfamily enzyme YgiQ (UPF0313 family)
MAHIVLINPRFEVSFWGIEHALPFFGKKANVPVACLPLLAALTPEGHSVTLIDENVEPIDFEQCARADIVGVTGMIVQRARMREILQELKRRGAFTVVGGPWVTVREDYFGELADVIFVGEAEETWPRFLEEWGRGEHTRRYEQAGKTDLTQVPVPRFDLLKMRRYACGSVQFSRGCPFTCEFCDIIVIFGRKPRVKTSAQVIAELEALRAQDMRVVFIVDDNLIGNKKAIREVLRDVAVWQEANGHPFLFFTEASLDLAEDEELMALMVEAGVHAVFVGVESPNEASLRETKKLQNVRERGGTMLDRIRTIQRAGMEVWSGMIVGFDNDDPSIFEAQRRFLQEARIANAMVGMLTALPKTPLHARLAKEGRLDPADEPEYGTNVIPARMSREELREGYVRLMGELYAPDAYFERLEGLYLGERIERGHARARYLGRHPWRRLREEAVSLLQAAGLYTRLMRGVSDAELRREYTRRLWRMAKLRPEPKVLRVFAIRCVMHYHYHILARMLAGRQGPLVNSF